MARRRCSPASTSSCARAGCTPSPAHPARGRRPCCTCWPDWRCRTAGRSPSTEPTLTSLDRAGRAALRRAKIAYVGQQAGLVPHLSALENVELALALRGLAGGRFAALDALESVGLSERATQRVGRLSQGERARVAIARAIASRPALLLADEPTSRLDGANAISVAILLARLARATGAAVVCSTHDPLVIEQAESQISLS